MSHRVLLISGEYPPLPGGVGDYTARLREALGAAGVETTVLTSRGASGDHVRTVGGWRGGAFRRISRLIRSERISLVHVQYQAGAFGMQPAVNALPMAIRARLGVPVVTTFHDLRAPYLFPKAGPLRNLVMMRMARASSAVVVTNPGDERALAGKRIETALIHIGPNLPTPMPAARQERGDDVAFFGYPTRSKGIFELVEALGAMDARERPRLILVGEQGTPSQHNDIVGAAEIDTLAEWRGVLVERTGRLSPQAASDRLARSGVVALPFQRGASLRSGSLLAALQSGSPVVTTEPESRSRLGSLAGMPQLSLVIRGDTEDLRDAIASALVTQVEPSALPDEFQWNSIAERHIALYESLWR